MTIIGYIHICQKGQWKRSFQMLINCIKKSGLYVNTKVIRLGIINDSGILIEDDILNDPLFQIVYIGKSAAYERPTLLHMRKKSEEELYTKYFYLHTKGIKHFGTQKEQPVIDWINLMLFWNIEKWRLALEKLEKYDTYGCNDGGHHYSGNFWWATSKHIANLPKVIPDNYTAPEDWVQTIRYKKYNVFSSGYQGFGHYEHLFPRANYEFVTPL